MPAADCRTSTVEPERFTTLERAAMVARREKITPVGTAPAAVPAIPSSLIAPDLHVLEEGQAFP
ncbi:hypothetical protein SAMN06272735_0174 [Streptomyces sp. TLI_55]|nr:hypothetical protein SAMN06272735_0174 [Streptomyces sp. TLI_55]